MDGVGGWGGRSGVVWDLRWWKGKETCYRKRTSWMLWYQCGELRSREVESRQKEGRARLPVLLYQIFYKHKFKQLKGDVAQMVERSLSMREVRGSIPRISISCFVFISALIDPNINQIYFFSLWGSHLPMGLPSSRTAKANGSLKHTHQPNPAPSTPDTENTFDWTTRIKAENEANKAESNSNNTTRRTRSHQKQYY